MKILATILLALSLPGVRPALPTRSPEDHPVARQSRKGGKWFMAENGHAVFCYGPVLLLKQPQGGLQKVATFCQGDKTIVPLKE